MYDDLFDFDSFDDISDYGYASESMFDYGADDYALEADNIFDKVKDAVKKIIDGLKAFIANFLQGLKHFLFGEKDQMDASKRFKFSAFGYVKELWKAAKEDAIHNLKATTGKGDQKTGADNIRGEYYNASQRAQKGLDLVRGKTAPFVGNLDDYIAEEAKLPFQKSKAQKRDEAVSATMNTSDRMQAAYRDFELKVEDIAKEAENNGDINVAKLFRGKIRSNMIGILSSGAEITASQSITKDYNAAVGFQSVAIKEAESTGKKVKNPDLIKGFKQFCQTLTHFFRYFGSLIKLSVASAKLTSSVRKMDARLAKNEENMSKKERIATNLMLRDHASNHAAGAAVSNRAMADSMDIAEKEYKKAQAKKNKKNNNSFLGTVAEESYNEGYQAALEDLGVDVWALEDDVYDDSFDFGMESYLEPDMYDMGLSYI